MKLQGEVGKLEVNGDGEVDVTITNVKRTRQAEWKTYGHEVKISMPQSKAKSFPIGRTVKLSVQAR